METRNKPPRHTVPIILLLFFWVMNVQCTVLPLSFKLVRGRQSLPSSTWCSRHQRDVRVINVKSASLTWCPPHQHEVRLINMMAASSTWCPWGHQLCGPTIVAQCSNFLVCNFLSAESLTTRKPCPRSKRLHWHCVPFSKANFSRISSRN